MILDAHAHNTRGSVTLVTSERVIVGESKVEQENPTVSNPLTECYLGEEFLDLQT